MQLKIGGYLSMLVLKKHLQ